jgi:putative heme-binding domain-containing protein
MKPIFLLGIPLLLLSGVLPSLMAQTHSSRSQANTPEQQLAGFTLPEGFVIELVASEREGVINPIDLTFDDAGRLWTQTARMYPLDPIANIQWNDLLNLMDDPEAQKNHPNFRRIQALYEGKAIGEDKILILSNLYGKESVKTTVWAEGLTIPQSILPYKNGAYVAQGSELFFLKDTNNDGRSDERIPLFTGFGFTDTHTMAHTLIRAPGGWIHFSHGALNKGKVTSSKSGSTIRMDYSKIARFSIDGEKMEIVTSGLNNIWGFQLRGTGEWYGSEANDLGYSIVPMEPGTGFPCIGNERIRSYQPWLPELHAFRVGGTGISGTAFSDDSSGSFPDEWKDVAFLANPITSSINSVRVVRNPDGTVTSEHLPDLLNSKDDWFRPVNMEFGPDGCLYIADWYNKIVSHNELPTTHPDRDKSHGRIWRIRHVSQQPREIPDFYELKTEDLVGYLKSPSLWAKRAAWHQISDRPASVTKKLAKELTVLSMDKQQDEITRIHALWSLEGISHYDSNLMVSLLRSPLHHLRRETARSLASFSLPPAEITHLLSTVIQDENPAVRSQAIRALSEIEKADQSIIDLLVRAAKPELPGNEMGGSYERKFERYLVRKALEQFPEDLREYIASPKVNMVPAENVLWAVQALPSGQKEQAFLQWWPKASRRHPDQHTFISLAQMLSNPKVFQMAKRYFDDPENAFVCTQLSLQNQSLVQSNELATLLQTPVIHLLQSKKQTDINLALDAVGRFNIQNVSKSIVAQINEQTPDKTLTLALKALETNPQENQNIFIQIFQKKGFGFESRAMALHSLLKANPTVGEQKAKQWITGLYPQEKSALINILSGSKEGANILLSLYEEKTLEASSFELPAAERVHQTNRLDIRGLSLLEKARKVEEEDKNAFQNRLTKLMLIAENKEGAPIKGKVLFQTCLMCHSVGDEGQDIAPALDGSANRENEALLTAILDPDAAVESNYAVYRITKKDGGMVEGYLVAEDQRGTTLAFMGGNKLFIPAEDIRSQGFLGGRSFMMKGLIDGYTDEQVADLLAYIRTLH